MSSGLHVFGIRHLSPSGGWHLRRYLDEVEPDVVLIEGLSDASGLISDMVRAKTKPPIAILAFTDNSFACLGHLHHAFQIGANALGIRRDGG